ncbi:UDP-N-acetylmuramate dehydrogenase [Halanaerocella petrolearia]
MINQEIKETLSSLVTGEVLFEEPLKNHNSFKIGGLADALVIPNDKDDLGRLVTYLYQEEISYWIIGNGTNLLISDQGLTGVVIKLSRLSKVEIEGNLVKAQAGVSLPTLATTVAKYGLSGLEFGRGLPASIGGAVVMNAGVKEQEIGEMITKVEVLSPSGQFQIYKSDELDFNYRNSSFQDRQEIIVEVELELDSAKRQLIEERMNQKLAQRRENQPLSLPNAGCIFKNPPLDSAGRLIDEAGGKGLRVGDAQVSTKHANFIVNLGNATADDVLNLIQQVEELVDKEYGIQLVRELEVLN